MIHLIKTIKLIILNISQIYQLFSHIFNYYRRKYIKRVQEKTFFKKRKLTSHLQLVFSNFFLVWSIYNSLLKDGQKLFWSKQYMKYNSIWKSGLRCKASAIQPLLPSHDYTPYHLVEPFRLFWSLEEEQIMILNWNC